ncbi:hypothetical protein ACFSQ0_03370 [Mesonia sediminis]|uniref:Lipoprotein n=1 Tax=Mesonia sediminis TaxID=1703946 RepID=A0ABW5SD06_9FLAO
MKNLIKLFSVIMSLLFIAAACKSDPQQCDINLNNGEKWQVNAEMKPHIKKGNELLTDFMAAKNKDYKNLAENLKTQNNRLIKSCTMKGESHDELHKWLHPHIELIEKLSKAENNEEAEAIIFKLQKSFENYEHYFQ